MGMVRTIGRFCYIECDDANCSRKIENNDEGVLKQLAKMCDWENTDTKWLCPDCASNGKTAEGRSVQKERAIAST